MGDLLDPLGTKLRPHSLNVNTPQYQDDKFPTITLPPRYQSFSDIWCKYIRQLVQSTPLGSALGPIVTRRTFEWALSSTKHLLIRYQHGIQVSHHKHIQDLEYDATPNTTEPLVTPAFVAIVSQHSNIQI